MYNYQHDRYSQIHTYIQYTIYREREEREERDEQLESQQHKHSILAIPHGFDSKIVGVGGSHSHPGGGLFKREKDQEGWASAYEIERLREERSVYARTKRAFTSVSPIKKASGTSRFPGKTRTQLCTRIPYRRSLAEVDTAFQRKDSEGDTVITRRRKIGNREREKRAQAPIVEQSLTNSRLA